MPAFRTLVALAWPIVISRSAQVVVGICDAVMVSHLGPSALAATTAGALNAYALFILPMGTVFVVASFSSQLHGAGDPGGARRYGWYGLALAAATQRIRASFLDSLCNFQNLLARFHRARARDDDDIGAADLDPANFDHRPFGARLAADQLERLSDRNDVLHARSHAQGLDFVTAARIADDGDNGARGATSHVGLKSRFDNALDDVLNLMLASLFRHVHNHGLLLLDWCKNTKAAISIAAPRLLTLG